MSHEVETMVYVREVPWHGLGTRVEEALTSADALRLAGLDWKVEQVPVLTEDGYAIDGYACNRRTDTMAPLGIVSTKYQVVQNEEAFAFTDALVGGLVKYETAGSLSGGKRTWMLAKLPSETVVGDEVVPYLCFVNSHDGTSAIKVCMTPVRVVCNNTLNLALRSAKRCWSTMHKGDLASKVFEARHALEMAGEYMFGLDKIGDMLANTTVSYEKLNEYLDALFHVKEEDSDRKRSNALRKKAEFMMCYYADDIKKFNGTAWGVVNAASDMATHNAPARMTENFRENNWGRIISGHELIDTTFIAMAQLAGVR